MASGEMPQKKDNGCLAVLWIDTDWAVMRPRSPASPIVARESKRIFCTMPGINLKSQRLRSPLLGAFLQISHHLAINSDSAPASQLLLNAKIRKNRQNNSKHNFQTYQIHVHSYQLFHSIWVWSPEHQTRLFIWVHNRFAFHRRREFPFAHSMRFRQNPGSHHYFWFTSLVVLCTEFEHLAVFCFRGSLLLIPAYSCTLCEELGLIFRSLLMQNARSLMSSTHMHTSGDNATGNFSFL